MFPFENDLPSILPPPSSFLALRGKNNSNNKHSIHSASLQLDLVVTSVGLGRNLVTTQYALIAFSCSESTDIARHSAGVNVYTLALTV